MAQWRKVWSFQVNLSPWVNPPSWSPSSYIHTVTLSPSIIPRGPEKDHKIPSEISTVDGSFLLNYVSLCSCPAVTQLAQLTALSPCLVWARLSKEETVPAPASRQREHGPGRQRRAPHRPHPVHRPHPGRHLLSQPAHYTPPLTSFHTTPLPRQVSLIPLPFILSTALLPCTHFFSVARKRTVMIYSVIRL